MLTKLPAPKKLQIILLIVAAIVLCNLSFVERPAQKEPYGTGLVGSDACKSCHADIYNSYIQTAHYNDSKPASAKTIKGSFEDGKNIFQYSRFMQVEMKKEGKQLMQVASVSGMEIQKAPFDIVIGSGRKGQTYLSWDGDNLFQLPISYYTETNTWCNSPGYPNIFNFDRPIPLGCLECHATYAKAKDVQDGFVEYDRSSIVLGIDCERCHGGGEKHVSYHLEHKDEKIGRYIVNTGKLDQQVRVDGCALCHSGFRQAIKPPFSFQFGDTLEHFSKGSPVSGKADTLDVHGNQYGLMAASKCYTKSAKMDCSSCHNVHQNEYNNAKLYSTRCLNCHGGEKDVHCSLKPTSGLVLEDNCIDCHMPVLSSNKIQLDINGKPNRTPDKIRTHYVSIYNKLVKENPAP